MMDVITRAEARERGLKRYFTGKLCKHGHIAERYTNTNICAACSLLACAKWRAANLERERARALVYLAANLEKVRATTRAWEIANPEKVRAYKAKWRATHPEKTCAYRAAYRARQRAAQAVAQAAE